MFHILQDQNLCFITYIIYITCKPTYKPTHLSIIEVLPPQDGSNDNKNLNWPHFWLPQLYQSLFFSFLIPHETTTESMKNNTLCLFFLGYSNIIDFLDLNWHNVSTYYKGCVMIDRKNEKLIHAMIFFIKKTKYCYKLKLFKLLYFLDFTHFKETGRSVTGLEYFAWPMGPVPNSLYKKIKNQVKLKKFFNFVPENFLDPDFKNDKVIRVIPKTTFDKNLFSKRELRIMEELLYLYKDTKSKDMTEISHDKKGPWYKVFNKENKPQAVIPYEYILSDSSQSISMKEAKEIVRENKEMENMFGSANSI